MCIDGFKYFYCLLYSIFKKIFKICLTLSENVYAFELLKNIIEIKLQSLDSYISKSKDFFSVTFKPINFFALSFLL